ncbi:putative methylcrotonoyl-CoA carboxylase beta chain, mitochondrial [Saccoglossus kowalevskii]|uniref:methylcrotonoyl-CoA carboxylase n=1 Tax=Saccoglossus kowalevskii TaxID=10224 RepID=A0ABM0GY06_SACKO|nr:PREDICTED: probable methylcrotonoyl-CoA carboxylase beta chain, mitochondrial-like [Saccoglossus kowalevskii]
MLNNLRRTCSRTGLIFRMQSVVVRSVSTTKTTNVIIKGGGRGRLLDGTIDTQTENVKQRIEHSKLLQRKYEQLFELAKKGGGEKGIERHTKKNKKLLVRDRIKLLVDNDGEDFLELSPLAGFGLEYGDVPAAGSVSGIGWIHGIPCLITGHDATIKGGTIYPIGVKKLLRSQEIGHHNRLPCIYIVDSGGAFLPLQDEIFPDKLMGGRGFYNQAMMSSEGIPQIALVCGSCTAGGAYVPSMSDEAGIVHNIGSVFLGGPPLVYAALKEIVTTEDLGGATVHCKVSGVTDHFAETEEEVFAIGRDIVETLNLHSIYDLKPMKYKEPLFPSENLSAFVTTKPCEQIDMYKLLAHIIDGSYFYEFKTIYGPTLITGFARICGHLVGIVANQGAISHDASLKGAHFVELCCQRNIPIIFLQNTESEEGTTATNKVHQAETLRCKGKLVATIACAEVPKITVVVGASFQNENLTMCGRSFDPRFLWIWPNAAVGLQDDCRDAFYSTARIWDDGIIMPQHTRQVLSKSLSIVKHFPNERETKFGVLRM